MRLKVYTLAGNVYEADGDIDNIREYICLHGTQDTYIYGMAERNVQVKKHRVIIPFSSIESVTEFDDDE